MRHQVDDLLDIMSDLLLTPRFDDKGRFKQMALEEKARMEQRLIPGRPSGGQSSPARQFNEADWAAEQMGGISYLFFLRRLVTMIEEDWESVLRILNELSALIINRKAMLVNVTIDEEGWQAIEPRIHHFMDCMPERAFSRAPWNREEILLTRLMVAPSQVNYVGKGADLYRQGYRYHGSVGVIARYLRTTWLWERVRVQGGATGRSVLSTGFRRADLPFLSGPGSSQTLQIFDETSRFLKELSLSQDELTKAIIGAIGDMDAYMLPDAKGIRIDGSRRCREHRRRPSEDPGRGACHHRGTLHRICRGTRRECAIEVDKGARFGRCHRGGDAKRESCPGNIQSAVNATADMSPGGDAGRGA